MPSWPEANADQVEAVLSELKGAVSDNIRTLGQPGDQAMFYRGRRAGIVIALIRLGYGDAAEQAIREVYERKGLRY